MLTLINNQLKIGIKKSGAELCEISSIKNGTQFMWNATPEIWGNFAPNLFPIVGILKDSIYYFEDKSYHLSKHGFIRDNPNFEIFEESKESITLKLTHSEDTLKQYPFHFDYYVMFRLQGNKIDITYKVVNTDSKALYFSMGAHPAFKCPTYPEENYSDYQLVFEAEETSKSYLLDQQTGLVTSNTISVFDTPESIHLNHHLFNQDALIFKDLKSRKISLHSKIRGTILTVHFNGFHYLGLWAKPNADFICIEPWLGIADSDQTNQQLVEKEGIIKLEANDEFEATYSIKGMSVISNDAILYAGAFKSSNKSTAVLSNGDEKQIKPSAFAAANN